MDKVLIDRLRQDYPEIRFVGGKKFLFRPPKTIVLGPEKPFELLTLHELGHFLCGHRTFGTEPERLKCEREAWERARELCSVYDVFYDEERYENDCKLRRLQSEVSSQLHEYADKFNKLFNNIKDDDK